jgi:transposase-like protein
VQAVLQELVEAEMTRATEVLNRRRVFEREALGAEKGERTPDRLGYRAGYYPRTLVTRVGKLELRVPQGVDQRGCGLALGSAVRARMT